MNSVSERDGHFNRWQIWWLAARPKTLPATAAPVIVGTSAAIADGKFQALPALAALLGALLLQIGANFSNDVGDFQKGADTHERQGPLRVTQSGLLKPQQVEAGMWTTFSLAALIGIYLTIVAGWPVILIGVFSILAALAYGVAVPPEEILTEGIEHITADDIKAVAVFGYVIKLLSIAKRTPHGVELRVHPALVNSRHPLAAVRGELNAFYLSGDVSGEVMFYGKGAGPIPTAGAVLSDVVRLANFEKNTWLSRRWNYDNLEHVPTGDIETGYHLIFPVLDKPGIIGRITSTLGSYDINIESAHAHLPEPRNGYGVVQILSSNARERDIRAAISAVSELPLLCGNARFFRIAVPAK